VKIKILAVDDEPVVLDVLKTMLGLHGYEVLAIDDSREALKRLEVEKVDGLFVDVRMPHLDGFELTLLTRALKLNGQVPIVMLTAWDDAETMREGFAKGISFFLGKPFSRERVYNLLGAVRGSLAREHLRYVRVPLRTTVDCSWRHPSEGHFKSDCQDISEGGMRLNPTGGLQVGQEICLGFSLPDVPRELIVDAHVVRKAPEGGIGLKFMDPRHWVIASIQRYVSSCVED
jgi:CheY-like chemotaxis protein